MTMRLPESFIEELRARTPLAALIGRRVKLSRSGRNWKACCPFHGEKTPSFYVYDDAYHCFGCGAHGDAISFVMQSQGAGFMDAVETLASEAGLDVPKPSPGVAAVEQNRRGLHDLLEAAAAFYARNLSSAGGATALAYLRRRGLTEESIQRFNLGWSGEGKGGLAAALAGADAGPARLLEAGLLRADEHGQPRGEMFFNRVMFPIRDRRGRVISFGGRTLGDAQPKYVNGPETEIFSKRRTLYGLDMAREAARQRSPVVVVEGYMDVIALQQAGFPGALAPLGTALTEDQVGLLWQMTPCPVLCFDGDAAGARAAARAAELVLPLLTPERTIRIATLPAGEDPDTLVGRGGAGRFQSVLDAARPLSDALFDLMREGAATDTPEGRAALRARLDAAAARIGDRGLASEYRRALSDRFFAAFRRGPAGRNAGAPSMRGPAGGSWQDRQKQGRSPADRLRPDRPVADCASAARERIRTLAAILIRHPVLWPKLEDALFHLELPQPARRICSGLRELADTAENLDFENVIAHLHDLDLAADVAWALGDVPCPLPAYACMAATASEAEAGWWHIYGLMRGSSLEADVAEARERFTSLPNAAHQARLIALCAALDQWRRGEDELVPAEQDESVLE